MKPDELSKLLTPIFVVGPTCSGKSQVAIELCKELNGEVVNIDSVQFYKGLDIGSAKILEAEQDGIPHHLLDIREPSDPLNVADYVALVWELLPSFLERGVRPIFCGGATMYISALVEGLKDLPPTDPTLRAELEKLSNDELEEILIEIDPKSAGKLHQNDRIRRIRAIEIAKGGSNEEEVPQDLFPPLRGLFLNLCWNRELLYDRINKRSEEMWEAGLLGEVLELVEFYGERVAPLKSVGYREALAVVRGELDQDEAINEIAQATRRYAKRQMVFWRNSPEKNGWEISPKDSEFIVGGEGGANRKGVPCLRQPMFDLISSVNSRLQSLLEKNELWNLDTEHLIYTD